MVKRERREWKPERERERERGIEREREGGGREGGVGEREGCHYHILCLI